ncbi:hypothetical protein F5B20DRAFT_587628 [Whalleya microplaca]|nr:hypothetical protein F5B20DRAFT_587628 [Whalleya microplaca]
MSTETGSVWPSGLEHLVSRFTMVYEFDGEPPYIKYFDFAEEGVYFNRTRRYPDDADFRRFIAALKGVPDMEILQTLTEDEVSALDERRIRILPSYTNYTTRPSQANVMQQFARRNYENTVTYYDCRIDETYLKGVIFERYEFLLESHPETGDGIDEGKEMKKLEEAVSYLRSNGLVHDALRLPNIRINEAKMLVLLGFGLCKTANGKKWKKYDSTTSYKKHNSLGLKEIGKYINDMSPTNILGQELHRIGSMATSGLEDKNKTQS